MNDEQFEKFEKVAQMLRRNRGADIKVRQEKEKLGNAFGFEKDKSKVNNEVSISKNQSSSSKSQKM